MYNINRTHYYFDRQQNSSRSQQPQQNSWEKSIRPTYFKRDTNPLVMNSGFCSVRSFFFFCKYSSQSYTLSGDFVARSADAFVILPSPIAKMNYVEISCLLNNIVAIIRQYNYDKFPIEQYETALDDFAKSSNRSCLQHIIYILDTLDSYQIRYNIIRTGGTT